MQLVILVYHMSGASRHLGIYMLIRVLVTSYLFLNGFGHLNYYWKLEHRTSSKDGAATTLSVRLVTVSVFLVGFCIWFTLIDRTRLTAIN
jgi:hypothetical protein